MPETLDAGGAGLGIHNADTAELNKWDVCYAALKENAELRKAITAIEADVAALHKSNQWKTLLIAVAYIAGFLSCAALTRAGLEVMR